MSKRECPYSMPGCYGGMYCQHCQQAPVTENPYDVIIEAKDKELAELREGVEKSEKKRDHWESLWKKSSMSVIGLQESNKELDKLKGFLSVERNKVEGWVEKCAEKDKRIGMLREALDNTKHSLVDILKNQELEHSPYWEDVSTAEKVLSAQPKPTTPSVPSEGE